MSLKTKTRTKLIASFLSLAALLFSLNVASQEPAAPSKTGRRSAAKGTANKKAAERKTTSPAAATAAASAGESEEDQLKAIVALAPIERIPRLQAFVEAHPGSALKTRASELMVSARAALGDEKLQSGDIAGGVEEFRTAISASPSEMSDKLYYEVVSQIPANLYLRGQRDAALDAAHTIEALVRANPNRVLALGSFFLRVEEPGEAMRLAESVAKVAPESASAHQVLGAAQQMSFHFDEAMVEFARALELDPKSAAARESLADLKRATGKPEEALSLYKEQLQQTPQNKGARAGMVLSLLELGRKDEAEREMASAMAEGENNLPLLAGTAYWYAAHDEGARAVELSQKAVSIEPRYTWGTIALARSLALDHKPFNSDGVLYYARKFGNFPTLDYELASALAVSGLYQEAGEALSRSFSIKDDQIETRLGNRFPARASNFTELLAPERRASIFQPAAADTESNARLMKALLTFSQIIGKGDGTPESIDEAAAIAAARDFASGRDQMRVYRQLFVSERLVQHGVGLQAAVSLMEAATDGVERALDVPVATMATVADAVRDLRNRAVEVGGTANIPELARSTRSAILRGRIEDVTGRALFEQSKTSDAITHFRRAVSVLPANTYWARTAYWHLGDALRSTGNEQEALTNYLKSYNPDSPDTVKRAVIQALYQKVNGSLDGLDEKVGAASTYSAVTNSSSTPVARPAGRDLPGSRPDDQPSSASQTDVPAAVPEPPISLPAKSEPTHGIVTTAPAESGNKVSEIPLPAAVAPPESGSEKPLMPVAEPVQAPADTTTQPVTSPTDQPKSEPGAETKAADTKTTDTKTTDTSEAPAEKAPSGEAAPPAAEQQKPEAKPEAEADKEAGPPLTRPRRATRSRKH
jgi:tetratricopeptide (TPR) repeat protein